LFNLFLFNFEKQFISMKKLITLALFLFCSLVSIAQTSTDDYYNPKPKTVLADKISTSITAGTGFSFLNANKSAVYTTFFAPKIGYQISPKFKLNVGLMHYTASGNTFMQLNRNEYILNTSNTPIAGNLIFVEGNYKLNPRLTMSGAVMTNANNLNTTQNNYKAASVALDYKVSEHSSIGVRVTISQGAAGYNMNPGTGNLNNTPIN
jgi:hypothetical protein